MAGAANMSTAVTVASNACDGIAWGDAIGDERKQRLWERLRAWWVEQDHGERAGPFAGEQLTGADIFWLAVCALARKEESTEDAAAQRLWAAQHDIAIRISVDLSLLHLQAVDLRRAELQQADLRVAHLQGADLRWAHLQGADLSFAQLERADLRDTQLQPAAITGAHGHGQTYRGTRHEHLLTSLQRTDLRHVQLQGADLRGVQFQGADLSFAQLEGADLREAHVNAETHLARVTLCTRRTRVWRLLHPWASPTAPAFGDMRWSGVGTVDLTQIEDWDAVDRLGDERNVGWRTSARVHQAVVRAYRQVAAQVRAQGMSEVADRLTHRALAYERRVFLRRGNLPRYLGSWALAILAGYGFRPLYTIAWYLVVIASFTFLYMQATHGWVPFGLSAPSSLAPLPWYEALILSVSSFHGRGFFQPVEGLGDPVAALAAGEAIVGLLIEVSFIATFTQRVFGK